VVIDNQNPLGELVRVAVPDLSYKPVQELRPLVMRYYHLVVGVVL
jgi:hypothetical protein